MIFYCVKIVCERSKFTLELSGFFLYLLLGVAYFLNPLDPLIVVLD